MDRARGGLWVLVVVAVVSAIATGIGINRGVTDVLFSLLGVVLFVASMVCAAFGIFLKLPNNPQAMVQWVYLAGGLIALGWVIVLTMTVLTHVAA